MWCQFGPKNHKLRPDAVPTLFGRLCSSNAKTQAHFEETASDNIQIEPIVSVAGSTKIIN